MMRISLIAAVAENGVIGRKGQLPWRLRSDLQRFKQLTMGHTVIVGRKTWESIGRPLPGRRSVVISRQSGYQAEGVTVVGSVEDAIATARVAGDDEAFVIGGAEVYQQALPLVERLYLTYVSVEVEGDAFFKPELDMSEWVAISSEMHDADANNDHPFTFSVLQRCEPSENTMR